MSVGELKAFLYERVILESVEESLFCQSCALCKHHFLENKNKIYHIMPLQRLSPFVQSFYMLPFIYNIWY